MEMKSTLQHTKLQYEKLQAIFKKAAMDSGVATFPITDWDKYKDELFRKK